MKKNKNNNNKKNNKKKTIKKRIKKKNKSYNKLNNNNEANYNIYYNSPVGGFTQHADANKHPVLKLLAEKYKCSTYQLLIKFVLTVSPNVIALPGFFFSVFFSIFLFKTYNLLYYYIYYITIYLKTYRIFGNFPRY